MQVGDALILTQPLGTGTLFAADLQKKSEGSVDSERDRPHGAVQCVSDALFSPARCHRLH